MTYLRSNSSTENVAVMGTGRVMVEVKQLLKESHSVEGRIEIAAQVLDKLECCERLGVTKLRRVDVHSTIVYRDFSKSIIGL